MKRPLRVYLAAKFPRRDQMRAVAEALRGAGYVITSRWLDVETDQLHNPDGPLWAACDVSDVLAADVLVLFSEQPDAKGAGRGGRHVEFGVALGAGKQLLVVGPTENIFHRHPSARVVATLGEMRLELDRIAQEAP